MKKLLTGLLAFFGIGWQQPEPPQSTDNVINEMRSMVLNLSPEEIGVTKENYPHEVFGIIMETGYDEGSFTLVALADNTTSLYFSSGGGILGAGFHEEVQKASAMLLSGANHFRAQTKPTSDFPLPEKGEVFFYLLGFDGITTYTAKEIELGENRDPLSKLFHVSHLVIAKVKESSEQAPASID